MPKGYLIKFQEKHFNVNRKLNAGLPALHTSMINITPAKFAELKRWVLTQTLQYINLDDAMVWALLWRALESRV